MKKIEGVKHDDGKPAMDLVPFDALNGVGKVLSYGAIKYGRHNWSNGMAWSRLIAATLRHIGKWSMGENIDEESGLSHIDHAACNLLMLSALIKRKVGEDDRGPAMEYSNGWSACCLCWITRRDDKLVRLTEAEMAIISRYTTAINVTPPPESGLVCIDVDDCNKATRQRLSDIGRASSFYCKDCHARGTLCDYHAAKDIT